MHRIPSCKSPNHQGGVALLLIMFIVIVTGSTAILASVNYQNSRLASELDISTELAGAKDALVAYAIQHNVNYASSNAGPGRLPCPDTNNDGAAEASCDSTVSQYMGRLPEFVNLPSGGRFEIGNHNSNIDQQFWYAVNPNFHMSGAGVAVNTSTGTNPVFTVDGNNDVVAVILAPGEMVDNQDRVSNAADDYLEGGNELGVNFVRSRLADPDNFNDKLVIIKRTDIINAAAIKAAEEIRDVLHAYHSVNHNYYFYISFWGTCFGPFSQSSFPQNNSINAGGPCFTETTEQAYSAAISSSVVAWFGNEQWDTVDNYTFVNNNQARITFTNCNIIFTYNYTGGQTTVSRDRNSCTD